MPPSGYYRMHRGWMDKRIFEREPYCRRAAWAWLIENAMFADSKDLSRGQLRHSLRYLGSVWGWPEAKVRRFLSALSGRHNGQNCRSLAGIEPNMIRCVTDAGKTLITICNYDKYQAEICVSDALPDARPTHDRRTTDANNKEGNKEEGIIPFGDLSKSASQIATRMSEIWKEVFDGVLPIPGKLSGARIRAARARFVDEFESSFDRWREFLGLVKASPFLTGDNDRRWRADFDFVLRPAKLAKIREGGYPSKPNGHAPSVAFDPEAVRWEVRVKRWQEDPGTWMADLWNTPPPDDPHTQIPPAVLQKFGYGK
jgi:hypothetical protein